jgi:hypothetical protein
MDDPMSKNTVKVVSWLKNAEKVVPIAKNGEKK